MRCLGLGPADIRARISDRRVARALLLQAGVPEGGVAAAFAALDKVEREPRDRLVRWLTEGGGLAAQVAERALAVGSLRGLDAVVDALKAGGEGVGLAEPLEECVAALEAMGLGEFVDVDLSVVRGLAYYSGIVFELFDARREFRAICGGGRYDGLLLALGGVDLPAVGFGMGDVVLGELLKARGLAPVAAPVVDAFVVAVTAEDLPAVLRLAHELRDRGVRVEYGLKEQTIAKQLKLAASRGARFALILGPAERAAGRLVMRDLARGEERRLPVAALAEGSGAGQGPGADWLQRVFEEGA
jgi:histidyl-tRNA synthetase